jgi:hypothetical protein
VHGLYGSVINSEKSLFTNDPMSHSDSIGVPHGHPALASFLGVPLNPIWKNLEDARDREWDYSSEQQEDLKAIVPASLQALHRKRSESALSVSIDQLGLALNAASASIWEWDIRTNDNIWSEEL